MPEEIVELNITNEYFNTEENQEQIFKLYDSIIENAKKLEVWSDSIKKIIITDNFIEEVKEQSQKWNFTSNISKEKEYAVVSKILFNHKLDAPEYYIYFNFQSFYEEQFLHWEIALGQILNIYSNKIIPNSIRKKHIENYPSSLTEHIEFASVEWCKAVHSRIILQKIFSEPTFPMNQNSFLITFKRKLKRSLYEYNSDKYENSKRLDTFWYEYYDSIKTLFLRLVEKETTEESLKLKDEESCYELVNNVIIEINNLTANLIESKEFDVTNLKKAVVTFSEHFEVFLENETDRNFRIRLTKNPKDYFIDEIVETEPRMVCFMDILGFSELINRYDSDITSTVLQDIQESFELAKTQLLEKNPSGNDDVVKHLRYQTFSDNICISIPYFDNENDFLSNFNLLATYIRGFQNVMMSKGIFMRGGISTGSYYADDNIIFSKGLVNAYYLESKKAIYPRVIIDDSIINKLFSYKTERLRYFGLDKTIIFDWENCAFLNPFGLIQSSISQFESVANELKSEIDDEDDEFTKAISTFATSMTDMTIGLMKSLADNDDKVLEPIKSEIVKNIYYYQSNSNVASKYIWLNEFIKWLEKDDSAKMKFETMSERLKNNEE
ncbi:hypothetical protein [Tenacibaculum crassostreae]|uniref:hypothetical protein n=1 Tax=Tenacibaculum crassostreae TaxID=502683 RepID=UPI003893FFCD